MSTRAENDDRLECRIGKEGWFEVKLSLTEGGMISVKFVDYEDELDEQWDVEKIRRFKPLHGHIRVVSEQLQDEECRYVSANQTVCALWNTENEVEGRKNQGWYDAFVTKVTPVEHDVQGGDETCTCFFTVTWLDGPEKGKRGEMLTCGNICLLSIKDVETHPFISNILSQANVQGIGKVQEEMKGGSLDSRDEQRVRELGLSPKTAELIQKLVWEQSEQAVDAAIQDRPLSSHSAEDNIPNDFYPSTSTEREIQDASLEFRPAEAIKRVGLTSATIRLLLGEETGENLSNPDPLEHSVQVTDAGIQDASLKFCPAAAIKRVGLSSATARLLLGEEMDENLSNPDPLQQSVQATDAEMWDVQPSSRSAEDSRQMKKMRGQVDGIDWTSPEIIEARDRILGNKGSARVSELKVQQKETMSLNINPSVSSNQVQQKTTTSSQPLPERRAKTRGQQETTTSAKPPPECRAKTKVVVDFTEDAACAAQPKKETVKAMVDSWEKRHLHSRPSAVQMKNENVKAMVDSWEKRHLHSRPSAVQGKNENVEAKADSLQEHHLSRRPSEVQGKEKKVKAETESDPLSERHLSRAEVLPSTVEEMKTEAFYYSRRKKVLAVPREAHRSKRLRITFDIDMEELPGSIEENFGGPKKDQFLHPDEEFKVGLRLLGTRLPRAFSANEELVDSNSHTRLGSTPKTAICLSDEEEGESLLATQRPHLPEDLQAREVRI